MVPLIVPLFQVGMGLLSAYGVYEYVQNNVYYEGVCTSGWGMSKDLSSSVFGQSAATHQILDFMSNDYDHGAHVLLLIGGPGVGKTYSTSIIEKHYSPHERIVGIVPSLQPLNNEALKLTKRKIKWVKKGFGLVIIDGHSLTDNVLLKFVSELNEFCLESKLTVKILIIGNSIPIHPTPSNSVSTESFKTYKEFEQYIHKTGKEAEAYFVNNKISCKLALFVPLVPADVKQCVEASFASLYLRNEPSHETVQEIVKRICGSHNDFSPSGCKDVEPYVMMSPK